MKKSIFFLITFFFFISIFSQKIGEIVLKKGDTIVLYNKITKRGNVKETLMSGQVIYYYNKEGRSKSINQSKIKSMEIVNGESYINLPIYVFGATRLHRVVAENDKYLLTDFYSTDRFQFYIFDKSTMKAAEKLKFQSYRPKKDIKLIKLIEKYFSDCPELMDKIQSNFDTFYKDKNYKKKMLHTEVRSVLFENISNYKCK